MLHPRKIRILLLLTMIVSISIYCISFFSFSNAASTTLSFTIVAATGNIGTGGNNTGSTNTGNSNNTGLVNTGMINTGVINTGMNITGSINTGSISTGIITTGNNSQDKGIINLPKEKLKDISTGSVISTGSNVESGDDEISLNTNIGGQSHGSSADTSQEKSDGKKIENKEAIKIYNNKKNNEEHMLWGVVDDGLSCDISNKIDNKKNTKNSKIKLIEISDDETTITGSEGLISDIFFSIKDIFASIGNIMTGNKKVDEKPICYTGEYLENEDKSTGFNYIMTGSGSLFTTIIKLIINYFN